MEEKPLSGWPGKVMVCMGISWNGPTSLYFVPPKAKMNSQMFIDLILEPLFKKDVPRLYPGEKSHPPHGQRRGSRQGYGRQVAPRSENKIHYEGEWMSNSPDLSPMDYGVNSI
ncbi:hypothetical protein BV898_18545 [Hypsibius exemplaris]|uniref:Uncharacterized protein n=1 Tax=Hypsibius exemplaris TaxID=2072580 RepID=A0A9X6RNK9_HYPEX|nr:hypothetical protein BV898_18545 [Hypsibius exemplaris]